MSTKKELPTIHFASAKEWEAWLKKNHASSDGVWLKIAKKDAGIESVTYPEALDAALCWGWIDGQKGALDNEFWLQRFTRRGPRSKWSKINTEKVAELIAKKKMKAPGLAEVEAARADGRWDAAYSSQRSMAVPDDLLEKLEKNPKAREFLAGLDSANRYAILYRIHEAKKPETRERRIEKFVAMLAEGKKLH